MRSGLLIRTAAPALAVLVSVTLLHSQTPGNIRRTPDGHADLSGTWASLDQSARYGINNNVPGALPWTKAPSYKPEFREKVKNLEANESKLDPVFYCAKPGIPRIGSPRKIVQLPNEIIFLYEDISGDTYRVIPMDGRKHNLKANPTYFGDAVGHWEQDVLVVDTTSFVEDTWIGEDGYFHSDKLHVIERLWLTPENNQVYQVTVDDPGVLTEPWTNFPHVIKPSTELLQESPPCKDDDGPLLQNLDHHRQR